MKIETVIIDWKEPAAKRLHEIPGNESAKRAIEVALTGGHEIVFVATVRSPASDLLRATARLATELHLPFKGSVVPVCPCGAYGTPKTECNCSVADMNKYVRKMLPSIQKAPIIIETVEPTSKESTRRNEPESAIGQRILTSHKNSLPAGDLSYDCENMLRMGMSELHVDKERSIAVASTIARMDNSSVIQPQHVAEAIQYQHHVWLNWVDEFEKVEVPA